MNEIFWDLLERGVVIYIDDILIYASTQAEHDQLVKEVLRRLRKAHVYLKANKCVFNVDTVEFLGMIVSPEVSRSPKWQVTWFSNGCQNNPIGTASRMAL